MNTNQNEVRDIFSPKDGYLFIRFRRSSGDTIREFRFECLKSCEYRPGKKHFFTKVKENGITMFEYIAANVQYFIEFKNISLEEHNNFVDKLHSYLSDDAFVEKL